MPPRLAVVPELDAELDRLYAAPLDEFTPSRNELATRLRKAGQGEAAERVRALRKPSVAVWTVNQLARRHPAEIAELVENGKRVRDAQAKALRGTGADDVRAATAAERASLRKVTRLAEDLLADEGRAATAATLERIASTLRAAAVEPDTASLLAAGRLPDEVESSGFAALAAMAPAPSARRGKATAKQEARKPKPNAAKIRKLEAHAKKLESRAADLAERAERAEAVAADARERAEHAKADAEAAARELRDARL